MNRLVLPAVLLMTVLICVGCAEDAPEIPVPTKATILADAKSLAETGSAEAQFSLGNLYAEGKVVPNDFTEATKWFHKAADQGYPQALYTLGVIYSGGHGVPVDFAEGYVWYCLAEKSGIENAREDCDSLADELQPEELVAANKRIDQLFEEIQLQK